MKENLLNKIKTDDSVELYHDLLMDNDVYIFKEICKNREQAYEKYDEFKKYVSRKLGIHFNDIAIVGSGKIGFSCNPKKSFRDFCEESDIDLIIISSTLFNRFWSEYLEEHYSEGGITFYKIVTSSIFRKFISLKSFEDSRVGERNEFYQNWLKKTLGFQKDINLKFGITNDLNYRIYESWDAAQKYHVNSFEQLKREMEEVD